MDKAQIGNKIKKLRKIQNLTQKQLADKLYVSDKTVSKWERGINLPDLTMFESLSIELNCSVIELLGLNDKNNEEIIKEVNEMHLEKEKIKINNIKRIGFMILMIIFLLCLLNAFYNFGNKDIR